MTGTRGTDPPPVTCLACSIFRREIEVLQASGRFQADVRYLDSMLHLVPERLEARLSELLSRAREAGERVVVAYGDCCPGMGELSRGAPRTEGLNCCEILLGRAEYRRLRREGVFFLLPEWARRWRHIFATELGLSEETARLFMRDMHTRLVYLDTGHEPVPRTDLEALSAYVGLPWEAMAVTLDPLLASLRAVLGKGPSDE
jgi:hypothetical protein